MNTIRFEKKRVNINIHFCSNPPDWALIKDCQALKPNIKWNGIDSWYITIRTDKYTQELENLTQYNKILSHFNEKEVNKFSTFFLTKNKEIYENEQAELKLRSSIIEKAKATIDTIPRLYKFQKEDVLSMFNRKNTLLANQMGSGKTTTAIAFAELNQFKKVLVVCPASLKLNWKKEILIVNDKANICILPSEIATENTKYYIINYDMLIKQYIEKKDPITNKVRALELKKDSVLTDIEFDCLLLDEAHYIKNNSKRTRAVLTISDTINYNVAITGTPIKNKTRDIFNLLLLIKHPITDQGFFKFAQTYCDAKKTAFGWDFNGSSNLEELHTQIKPYMVRRLKADVLDLPDKVITEIYVEMDKSFFNEYEVAFSNYLNFLRTQKLVNLAEQDIDKKIRNVEYAQHLVQLGLLKQLCARAKSKMMIERIDDLLDETDDRKIVIFTQYDEIINIFRNKYFNNSVVLTGATSMVDRQKAVDDFQTEPNIRLFISNIQAGGVGITLTKADTLMFADLSWTPTDHSQAMDRIHRISQENICNIMYFICTGTIEEDIFKLLDTKQGVQDKVIDNTEYTNTNNRALFNQLVAKLSNKALIE